MAAGPVSPPTWLPRCSTLELKDLADVIAFEDPADIGTEFGLELIADGVYRRKELKTTTQKPRLEQIRNVEVETFDDVIEHKLTKRGNKWVVRPVFSWPIRFVIRSPNTYIDRNEFLKKVVNSGPTVSSLVPAVPKTIKIKEVVRGNIEIFALTNANKSEDALLNVEPLPANIPDFLTLQLDVLITKGNSESFNILPGLACSWTNILPDGVKHIRVQIIVTKTNDELTVRSTIDAVTLVLTKSEFGIKSINIKSLDLLGFYLINRVMSKPKLNTLQHDFTDDGI